jgi:hypothetical protein
MGPFTSSTRKLPGGIFTPPAVANTAAQTNRSQNTAAQQPKVLPATPLQQRHIVQLTATLDGEGYLNDTEILSNKLLRAIDSGDEETFPRVLEKLCQMPFSVEGAIAIENLVSSLVARMHEETLKNFYPHGSKTDVLDKNRAVYDTVKGNYDFAAKAKQRNPNSTILNPKEKYPSADQELLSRALVDVMNKVSENNKLLANR